MPVIGPTTQTAKEQERRPLCLCPMASWHELKQQPYAALSSSSLVASAFERFFQLAQVPSGPETRARERGTTSCSRLLMTSLRFRVSSMGTHSSKVVSIGVWVCVEMEAVWQG